MKVSVIIPAYNCVTWLPHAVASALEQTHKDVEVVIVNDGSTDRTGEYLEWLSKNEKRAAIVHPGKNIGRSAARNLGNQTAQGDILCVLDADDLATPNRAEVMVRRFKKGGVDMVYGPATCIDAIGRPQMVLPADAFELERARKELTNGIVHSTVAYTPAFAKRYPYRDGQIAKLGLDDWAMVIEAATDGAMFDFVPQRLACYRLLEGQVTRTRSKSAVKKAKLEFLESLMAVPA